MVAAAIFSRHGPASRSAARRKIAARSSNGVAAQCVRANDCSLHGGGGITMLGISQCAQRCRVPVRLHDVDPFTIAHAMGAADDVR